VAAHGGSKELQRSVRLAPLILYGVGTTIGAGIYALVGKVAGAAGMYAPLAFGVATLMAAFTAFSYAEISTRHPHAAGSAEYVRQAFGTSWLPIAVGVLVVLAGTVSMATICKSFVGYMQALVAVPDAAGVIGVVLLLGIVAVWGISESVATAGVITVIEVAGLLLVIVSGGEQLASLPARLGEVMPGLDLAAWNAVFAASLLAFYAFLGFEDMVTLAEEVVDVRRVLPLAVIATLALSSLLYLLLALISVLAVPPAELAASKAPLVLVYERTGGVRPELLSIIGMVALINGALVQAIMSARMLYGLARLGKLPAFLAAVHPKRRTPVVATAVACTVALTLALLFPLTRLAEAASAVTLLTFSLVNLALWILKRREPAPPGAFVVAAWVPVTGFFLSLGFVAYRLQDAL
jgi:amino acid transporter